MADLGAASIVQHVLPDGNLSDLDTADMSFVCLGWCLYDCKVDARSSGQKALSAALAHRACTQKSEGLRAQGLSGPRVCQGLSCLLSISKGQYPAVLKPSKATTERLSVREVLER